MPLNLLLLPLISGYYFTHHYIPLQYHSERLEGHRLIFDSALWGLAFLSISYVLVYLICKFFPWALHNWSSLVPYDKLGTSLLSLIIGISAAYLLNRFVDEQEESNKVISEKGTELEKLVLYAAINTKLLSITLKNNKAYIGFISKYPEAMQKEKFINILPALSGYRDEQTKELNITTDYDPVYRRIGEGKIKVSGLQDKDLEITIPVSEVLTTSIYNAELRGEFQ